MHNGRFKSPILHYGFYALTIGVALATLGYESLFHMHGAHNHGASAGATQVADCHDIAGVQTITLNGQGFQPHNATVKRCTLVVFTVTDHATRLPAFGEHEHHDHSLPYTEKTLRFGQTNSVVMNEVGTVAIHDHEHEELAGSIHITQ